MTFTKPGHGLRFTRFRHGMALRNSTSAVTVAALMTCPRYSRSANASSGIWASGSSGKKWVMSVMYLKSTSTAPLPCSRVNSTRLLRRLGRCGLGELPRELHGLGDAFLAGHGLHPGTLDALELPQRREILTLPLAGGAGSRRHRELALGLLHGGRPRTRRATRCLGGSVACLERLQFAFERRDTNRSLLSEAPDLCERGLALLDQPIDRVGEVNGGNLPKRPRRRHVNLPSTADYQDTRSRATFALANRPALTADRDVLAHEAEPSRAPN